MAKSDITLCEPCSRLDILALIEGLGTYESRKTAHQPSYASLIQSMIGGCQLCLLLHTSLFKTEASDVKRGSRPIEMFRRTSTGLSTLSSTGQIEDVVGWHEDLDTLPRVEGFFIEARAESTLDTDFAVEYSIHYTRQPPSSSSAEAPKPRRLVLSSDENVVLGIRNRPIADFPSFRLYSDWIQSCAHGKRHFHCDAAEETALPARLVDVGEGTGAKMPRLASTAGEIGSYLTLSHCWGSTRPLVTTAANLAEHSQGIPFARFPKLFQDAMVITKLLGYRYLWIDSLCIVQDDAADWEEECSRMGDIYRNSVCTLAAVSGVGGNHSLLAERPAPDLPSFKLLARRGDKVVGNITIGPPPPDFKERGSILSTRAWILQEQILAPRTLYFGSRGMYFQCNSHEYLESYHYPLPPERMTPWRTSEAGDLPKTLLTMAIKDVLYWYSVVRQYSFRLLTYGDDKLPALSGLANMISSQWDEDEESPFGDYLAGLWSNDLIRGLTWTADTTWNIEKALHAIDDFAPSWSWASQNTPVEWKTLREFKADCELVSCDMVHKTSHKFGRVQQGSLKISAPTRSCSLHRRGGTKAVFLSGIGESREVAEVALDATTFAYLESTWSFAASSFICRALLLGKAESSLYGSRWYALLLAPASDGKWKRIGLCSSLGTGMTHARSLSVEQSYGWFGSAVEENVVII